MIGDRSRSSKFCQLYGSSAYFLTGCKTFDPDPRLQYLVAPALLLLSYGKARAQAPLAGQSGCLYVAIQLDEPQTRRVLPRPDSIIRKRVCPPECNRVDAT